MDDVEAKKIVMASASIVIDAVVSAIGNDGHVWGNRPCETCRTVSGITGRKRHDTTNIKIMPSFTANIYDDTNSKAREANGRIVSTL